MLPLYRHLSLPCSLLWLLSSCSPALQDGVDPDDIEPPVPFPLDLAPIDVEAGEELIGMCQSVTLDNDEPIAVNAVTMNAGPAWHHANWFFVPEEMYEGPDGSWRCHRRGFDTVAAAASGGVLFAMSTQAQYEEQQFEPGAAMIIPPRSKVVGEVHLINATDTPVSTGLELEVTPIAMDDLETRLVPGTFVYYDLELPPMATSEFGADCMMEDYWGGPLDLRIHYVLPHYHDFGTGMRLTALGGPMDGETIYEVESTIGEPLSGAPAQPFDLTGAEGVRFSCTYQNNTEDVIGWGLGGSEMCVAFFYTDSAVIWGGYVDGGGAFLGETDGVMQYGGPCRIATSLVR